MYAAPSVPSPPDPETAATNSGVVVPPAIPAWMTGYSTPRSFVSLVFIKGILF
jgi:hypothetical protein